MRSVYILICWLISIFSSGVYANEISSQEHYYSLQECIEQGLQNHPKIKMYKYIRLQKEHKLDGTSGMRLPKLELMTSYDRVSYVAPAKKRYLNSSHDDYQTKVVASAPLYNGGAISATQNAAELELGAVKQSLRQVKDEIVFDIKTAYFKLLYYQEILEAKKVLLRYAKKNYSTAKELNERTKLPRKETLLRLQIQQNEVEQELLQARENLSVAQKTLLNVMGMNLNRIIKVKDIAIEFTGVKSESLSLQNSPQLLKIGKEMMRAHQLVNVAKSDYYPTLSFYSSYGYEWAQIDSGKTDWVLGLRLSFDLWDWGIRKAKVNEAKTYTLELKTYRDLIQRQLDLDLKTANLNYESATRRYKIARVSYLKAKESLNVYIARYRNSLVSTFELLDAQKSFSKSQNNLSYCKLETRLAKAKIEKLTGNIDEYK
ncbi:MAG: TolC family protein [Bacteriovoracia bacterium]